MRADFDTFNGEEVWKPVPSLPGFYASSWGRIRLPEIFRVLPTGAKRTYKTKPRFGDKSKSKKGATHQHLSISTRNYGHLKVHRLVCEAFHGPAPEGLSVVSHKNENAMDNRPENLKWATQKENMNMPGFIAKCRARTGENSAIKMSMKAKAARAAMSASQGGRP